MNRVAIVGLALAAVLALAYGMARGDWLRGLLAGLTLAMAILPEELLGLLWFESVKWGLQRSRGRAC